MATKIIKYRDWIFVVDVEMTKSIYQKRNLGSAEECGCYNCLNFAANRNAAYPDEVNEFFENIGLDISKECEVSHICKTLDGLHYYQGWFYFAGNLISGFDCHVLISENSWTDKTININQNFRIGFTIKHSGSFSKDGNYVQIVFECFLPWVIDKKLEYD